MEETSGTERQVAVATLENIKIFEKPININTC